jgi:hypothetical protein
MKKVSVLALKVALGLGAIFIMYAPRARADLVPIVQQAPISYPVTVNMSLPAGLSMISLPVNPAEKRVRLLFPKAQAVFGFTKEYLLLDPNDELEVGRGYWIDMPAATTCTLTGAPIESYELPKTPAGWSLIGSCSYPAFPSVKGSNDLIRAGFGFSRKYTFLGSGDTIAPMDPGQGYWINLSEGTTLYGQIKAGSKISPVPGTTLPGDSQTFTWDDGGTMFRLYAGSSKGASDYYRTGTLSVNQATVEPTADYPGLPLDGSPVHIRLWSYHKAGWSFTDYLYRAALFTCIESLKTGYLDAEPADGMDKSGYPGTLPGHRSYEIIWPGFQSPSLISEYGLDIGSKQGAFDYDSTRPGTIPGSRTSWVSDGSHGAVIPRDGSPV